MIIRTRTTRDKPSPVGVVAAVVVSFVSLSLLLHNCQDVLSFSTTTPTFLSSPRQLCIVTCMNYRGTQKIFFQKSGTTNEGEKGHRLLTTKIKSQKNNNSIDGSSQPWQRNNNNNKYKDRKQKQQREHERRELQNKLHRARDSILYYGQDSGKDRKYLPSMELRSYILREIVQSYTSAIIESSLPTSSSESNPDAVLKLFDPWEAQQVILAESRPVQERILGLLAVLIQIATHIEEEYILYDNDYTSRAGKGKRKEKTMPYSTKKAIDHIRFVQSRLWETSREVLRDMAAVGTAVERKDDEEDTQIIPKEPHVVSPIAVTALAKALRESSTKSRFSPDISNEININYSSAVEEIKELMQLVDDARKAVSTQTQTRNRKRTDETENGAADQNLDMALVVAWNNYLSSLCDRALATKNPSDVGLGIAAKLVMQNDNDGIVASNIVSYNTVLNIAARVGNASLVDTMWRDLTAKREEQQDGQLSLQPNSRTYNARLMVTNDDKQRLEILDKEIIPGAFHLQRQNVNASDIDTFSVIDSFTIDMMVMPLLQANRKKQLFQLIDHWMTLVNRQHNVQAHGLDQKQQKIGKNSAQRAFKNALAAFFITLVQRNGNVRMAREIWDRYMVLNIDNKSESINKSENNTHTDAFIRATNIVSPERRHYNIVLDGYARLVDQVRDRQARNLDRTPDTDRSSSNEKATRTTKIWEAAATLEDDNEEDDRDATSTSEYYEDVQEKAIRDGQELFATMMAQQQLQNSRNRVGPDAYTKSTMIRLCRNGSEVQNLLEKTSAATATATTILKTDRTWLPRAVTRAAVTTCGRLGDPSMACVIFDQYMFPDADSDSQKHFSNYRAFNVILGALASGAKLDNPRLDVTPTILIEDTAPTPSFLLSKVHGLTCTEAVVCILNLMPSKNSQTYCVAASALQYAPVHERIRLSQANTNITTVDQNMTVSTNDPNTMATPLALQIFHNATRDGIQADGRLVNAIFRCYGDDIAGALDGWKNHIRTATHQYEQETRARAFEQGSTKRNMLAAYNGLLYVCGRAERPDIAVRIVYAMKNKEGLDPSENPYNNYRSGKSTRKSLVKRDEKESSWRGMLPKIDMVGQYENILYVECKKYDARDRRMEKDNRIRIIV
jgi:hypothetical protein